MRALLGYSILLCSFPLKISQSISRRGTGKVGGQKGEWKILSDVRVTQFGINILIWLKQQQCMPWLSIGTKGPT